MIEDNLKLIISPESYSKWLIASITYSKEIYDRIKCIILYNWNTVDYGY